MQWIAPLHNLQELSLVDNRITDSGVSQLASLGKLESLELSNTLITGRVFSKLSCSHLNTLAVAWTNVDDDGAKKLARFPELKRIELQGTRITSRGVAALMTLPSLEYLDVGFTPYSPHQSKMWERALNGWRSK
jgi:Ran GTPase-activating protein (RanGAP) involved in mRNA processing and transport